MVMETPKMTEYQEKKPRQRIKFSDWLIVIGFLAIPFGIWIDPRITGTAIWILALGIVLDYARLKQRIKG